MCRENKHYVIYGQTKSEMHLWWCFWLKVWRYTSEISVPAFVLLCLSMRDFRWTKIECKIFFGEKDRQTDRRNRRDGKWIVNSESLKETETERQRKIEGEQQKRYIQVEQNRIMLLHTAHNSNNPIRLQWYVYYFSVVVICCCISNYVTGVNILHSTKYLLVAV